MHSDDLVKSLLFINKFASTNCETFNIGSNEVVEIHELANSLSNIYGFKVTGMKEIDESLPPDIYTPNINKLLSKGFKLDYNIKSSINNIINN
jgi:nucleoside-diphosphate-sugar epimerase